MNLFVCVMKLRIANIKTRETVQNLKFFKHIYKKLKRGAGGQKKKMGKCGQNQAKNQEKLGKVEEKMGKTGRFFHLAAADK